MQEGMTQIKKFLKKSGSDRDLGQSSISLLCPKAELTSTHSFVMLIFKTCVIGLHSFPRQSVLVLCTLVCWIAVEIQEVLRCHVTINFHIVCVKMVIYCTMVSFVLPCQYTWSTAFGSRHP